MRFRRQLGLVAVSVLVLGWCAAVVPSPAELTFAAAQLPPRFSFTYDGKPSTALLLQWKQSGNAASTTWRSPDGFWVRRNVSDHSATHAARIWVLDFGLTCYSAARACHAGVLVLPKVADLSWADGSPGGPTLHWADGSNQSVADFKPHVMRSLPGKDAPRVFVPRGGRSSDGTMPYFNLESSGATMSWMFAVGWTGTWRASFSHTCPAGPTGPTGPTGSAGPAGGDGDCTTAFAAGMNTTQIRLRPGECIRTPAVAQLAYRADTSTGHLRGHNLWRHFMLSELSPRPAGMSAANMMPRALSSASMDWNFFNTTNQIEFVRAMKPAFGDSVDTYWMDAGWDGKFPYCQGNWTPDPTRFPPPRGCNHPSCGLEPLAAALKAQGTRFLLWVEPERVMPNTSLASKPEWLLVPSKPPGGCNASGPEGCGEVNDGWRMLDFGNDAARAWAVKRFSGLITNLSLSIYRQDCNVNPMFYWWTGEAKDRQGMNEIRYITGLYEYWDELLLRHPSLLMDSCASGGRRLDFEVMRRMVVLTPSDDMWDDGVSQAQSFGLAHWLPLAGAPGAITSTNYSYRSGMASGQSSVPNLYHNCGGAHVGACGTAMAGWRQEVEQWQAVRQFFSADFYPLTPWSTKSCATQLPSNVSQCSQINMCCPTTKIPARVWDRDWIAWQLHRSGGIGIGKSDSTADQEGGLVLAFRRAVTPGTPANITLHLHGLVETAEYSLERLWDTNEGTVNGSGAEWMTGAGVQLAAAGAPVALVLQYKLTA